MKMWFLAILSLIFITPVTRASDPQASSQKMAELMKAYETMSDQDLSIYLQQLKISQELFIKYPDKFAAYQLKIRSILQEAAADISKTPDEIKL